MLTLVLHQKTNWFSFIATTTAYRANLFHFTLELVLLWFAWLDIQMEEKKWYFFSGALILKDWLIIVDVIDAQFWESESKTRNKNEDRRPTEKTHRKRLLVQNTKDFSLHLKRRNDSFNNVLNQTV